MSEAQPKNWLAEKIGVTVLLLEAIPAFFLVTTWQGWLLLLGVAVIAFLVTAILTQRHRT